jgi:hypothetical protein
LVIDHGKTSFDPPPPPGIPSMSAVGEKDGARWQLGFDRLQPSPISAEQPESFHFWRADAFGVDEIRHVPVNTNGCGDDVLPDAIEEASHSISSWTNTDSESAPADIHLAFSNEGVSTQVSPFASKTMNLAEMVGNLPEGWSSELLNEWNPHSNEPTALRSSPTIHFAVSEPLYLQKPKTNRLAIASLILGLFPAIPVIGSILAVVLGKVAKKQIGRFGVDERGERMATAGMILGVLFLIGYVAFGLALHSAIPR